MHYLVLACPRMPDTSLFKDSLFWPGTRLGGYDHYHGLLVWLGLFFTWLSGDLFLGEFESGEWYPSPACPSVKSDIIALLTFGLFGVKSDILPANLFTAGVELHWGSNNNDRLRFFADRRCSLKLVNGDPSSSMNLLNESCPRLISGLSSFEINLSTIASKES